MKATTHCLALVVLSAAALPALGQVAVLDPVAVTAPDLLVDPAYALDARGIDLHLHAPVMAGDSTEGIQGFNAGTRHTTVAGFDFHPNTHTVEYVKGPSFLILNGGLASLTAGAVFESQLHMPQNARMRFMDVFGTHDTTGRTLGVALVRRCLPFLTGGNATQTVLATMDVTDQDGLFVVSPPIPANSVVDNFLCTYHARLRFGDAAAAAPGVTMQVAKVRMEWIEDRIFAHDFELP